MNKGVNIFEELVNEEGQVPAPPVKSNGLTNSVSATTTQPSLNHLVASLSPVDVVADEEKFAANALCEFKSYPD